jgi:hypothetical protein
MSLHSILRLLKEELGEWGALALENPTNGATVFNSTVQLINETFDASKVEHVRTSVHAFLVRCQRFDESQAPVADVATIVTTPTAQPVVTLSPLAAVDAEIARLNRWIGKVRDLQVTLQDEKNDIVDYGREHEHHARLQALNDGIVCLAEVIAPICARVESLARYASALAIVESGIPDGSQEFQLPPIPDIDSILVKPEKKVTSVVAASPSTRGAPENARRHLEDLAYAYTLLPLNVLAYSLYDVLGAGNEKVDNAPRGLLRVLRTAQDVGILSRYGWEDAQQALKGSSWQTVNEDGIISFRGKVARSILYMRSRKELPWSVHSVITAEEQHLLLERLREKAQLK